MAERPKHSRADQASRLTDRLYYRNPRVSASQNHLQSGFSDAVSMNTANNEDPKLRVKSVVQAIAQFQKSVMNEGSTHDFERGETDTRKKRPRRFATIVREALCPRQFFERRQPLAGQSSEFERP